MTSADRSSRFRGQLPDLFMGLSGLIASVLFLTFVTLEFWNEAKVAIIMDVASQLETIDEEKILIRARAEEKRALISSSDTEGLERIGNEELLDVGAEEAKAKEVKSKASVDLKKARDDDSRAKKIIIFFSLVPFLAFVVYRIGQSDSDSEFAIDDREMSLRRYTRFLVLLGSLLIVLGLASGIGLSGLVFDGTLTIPIIDEDEPLPPLKAGRILGLSIIMGVLGSVFFTANVLFNKRQNEPSNFDVYVFWGGFCFRMGESVVFVLVFFLISIVDDGAFANIYKLLPILALFLGMFVKSGERIVFGISERVFKGFEVGIPPVDRADPRPVTPPLPTAPTTPSPTVSTTSSTTDNDPEKKPESAAEDTEPM